MRSCEHGNELLAVVHAGKVERDHSDGCVAHGIDAGVSRHVLRYGVDRSIGCIGSCHRRRARCAGSEENERDTH
jgi:hypothetical protein